MTSKIKMKKIAIVTWTKWNNYGTILSLMHYIQFLQIWD